MRARLERVGGAAWGIGLLIVGLLLLAVWGEGADLVMQLQVTLMLVNVVLVVGLYAFVGTSGVVSFGQMSFMAVGAYVTALVTVPPTMKHTLLPHLPGWIQSLDLAAVPAVAVVVVFAGLLALILSGPLMRLSGLAAALAMFAVLLVVHNVASNWEQVTRGNQTMIGVPDRSPIMTIFLFAAAAICVVAVFQSSAIGLRLRATRDDPFVAQASGIGIASARRVGFVLSGILVGVGGYLYAQVLGSFSPNDFYVTVTFATIAMLVVGGINSLSGAVVGTVAISVVSEILRRVEEGTHIGPLAISGKTGVKELGLAAVLLLVLLVRPSGITGGRELTWDSTVAAYGALRKRFSPGPTRIAKRIKGVR